MNLESSYTYKLYDSTDNLNSSDLLYSLSHFLLRVENLISGIVKLI